MTGSDRREENPSSEVLDSAWKIHGALADWTGKVDAKASFALTIESASIVATISLSAEGRTFSKLQGWQVFAIWSAITLFLTAAVLAIVVVIPRLRRGKLDAESATNFIYFGHLRHWQRDDLVRALERRPLLPVLATQLINMSRIAWRKHRLVQISLLLASLGAIILLFLAAVA